MDKQKFFWMNSKIALLTEKFNETIDWHQFEPSDGARIENLLEQPS